VLVINNFATKACIDVVLASCNGQAYIQQQIESIQHCVGYADLVVRLLVVDDASTDATAAIVMRLAQDDSRIVFVPAVGRRLGCVMNFARGLELSTAPYIMLSDQDDVWLPQKIIKSLARLQCCEQQYGVERPALLFTDLKVVDDKLSVIANSFWSYQSGSATWSTCFKNLLVQNVAAGCTMLFNRALIGKATPIPKQALMHDWWLLLVARVFGEVVYISEPMGLYRQHGDNSVGAQKMVLPLSRHFVDVLEKSRLNLYQLSAQAIAFNYRYGEVVVNLLSADDRQTLYSLINLPNMCVTERIATVVRGNIRKNNLYRNIGLLFVLLLPVPVRNGG